MMVFASHSQSPRPRIFQAHRSQGPLLRRHYYGINALPTLSDSAMAADLREPLRPLPSPLTGLPRLPEPPFTIVPVPTTRRIERVRVSMLPHYTASPNAGEGRHPDVNSEALPGLHMLRHRIASSAQGDLCTRLSPAGTRPNRSQPTRSIGQTLWWKSSSLVIRRRRGELPLRDIWMLADSRELLLLRGLASKGMRLCLQPKCRAARRNTTAGIERPR